MQKSVVGYFEEQYNKKLEYPQWPAIQCKRGGKLLSLPMEVCYMDRGQVRSIGRRQQQEPGQCQGAVLGVVLRWDIALG